MARRRAGRPIHGWLVIDKDAGLSSAQTVAKVRRITGAAKAGHGGSLDPMATGVLPVALGEATKTVSYAMQGEKRYRVTARWGEARSTDDAEGDVTEVSDVRPAGADITAALGGFTGAILQVPPAYSAIKVSGQRSYALARAGTKVELAAREVRIHALSLVDMPDPDHAVFDVRCGKGTYMRSLVRDLAARLGTVGHVAALRRLAVGSLEARDAISLEKLATLWDSVPPSGPLLPVEAVLDDIPALNLTDTQAAYLRQGRPVRLLAARGAAGPGDLTDGDVLCAMTGGRPVALARFESGEIHPVRVLNL